MKNKGITLVALIITIIVLLILAFTTITIVNEYKIFKYSKNSAKDFDITTVKEQITLSYSKTKLDDKNAKGTAFFEKLKDNMGLKDVIYVVKEDSLLMFTEKEYSFKVLEDGTVIEEEILVLDIGNGCIDIGTKGYICGVLEQRSGGYNVVGEQKEYTGTYIITGKSNENAIRIIEKGKYDIIFKDLEIDLTEGLNYDICTFNANRNKYSTGVYVNLYLSGNNYLHSTAAGIGFAGATPNINGVTDGSTLTIGGSGSLYVEGNAFCAGIGSGYTGWECAAGDANNIIINSGTITAKTGSNGCAIGGGFKKNVNNIIINDGRINAIASNRAGIGAAGASVDNIIINGGDINVTGGEYGAAIGGGEGSGRIIFNDGNITATKQRFKADSLIGQGCKIIEINGGIINGYSENGIGIGSTDNSTQQIIIRGGTLNIEAKARKVFY